MLSLDEKYKLFNGDSAEVLRSFPDASVDCVISSPPYYQLRDYGFDGQWGLESTFQAYLEKLWSLMDEVWRVLKPTGTVWINLGDTYAGSNGFGCNQAIWRTGDAYNLQGGKATANNSNRNGVGNQPNVKGKSLLMIPHRFAIGCSERGWLIRNDCIWAKRNGMPESVTDRFSKKHEYFFLMAKQAKYYFDLDSVRDEHKAESKDRYKYAFSGNKGNADRDLIGYPKGEFNAEKGKNPGDVADFWDIPTRPSSVKHYATFNTELIDKPIKAGCPENGVILDMFCGTATTGVRALQLNRKFIGIDGNAEYVEIAKSRMSSVVYQAELF